MEITINRQAMTALMNAPKTAIIGGSSALITLWLILQKTKQYKKKDIRKNISDFLKTMMPLDMISSIDDKYWYIKNIVFTPDNLSKIYQLFLDKDKFAFSVVHKKLDEGVYPSQKNEFKNWVRMIESYLRPVEIIGGSQIPRLIKDKEDESEDIKSKL